MPTLLIYFQHRRETLTPFSPMMAAATLAGQPVDLRCLTTYRNRWMALYSRFPIRIQVAVLSKVMPSMVLEWSALPPVLEAVSLLRVLSGPGLAALASDGDAIDATGGSSGYALNATGNVVLSATQNGTSQLQFQDASEVYVTTFAAGTQSGSINYTLPLAQGSANTVLTNDGSGNLSWAPGGGGGITLPFEQTSGAYAGPLFQIGNTDGNDQVTYSIEGDVINGYGVVGTASGQYGNGVYGLAGSGGGDSSGVVAEGVGNAIGLTARSVDGDAIDATQIDPSGSGNAITAVTNGTGTALFAAANGGGLALNANGNVQINGTTYAESETGSNIDVIQASNFGSGNGIEGDAGFEGYGVVGSTAGNRGIGVYGNDNFEDAGTGVYGGSITGVGVNGSTTAGGAGVQGYSAGDGSGVDAINGSEGPALTAQADQGDAIDATASVGYALNANGNVTISGNLENTTDNNQGSDGHGISPNSIDWATTGRTGYAASITNENSGNTGDGLLVKVYDNSSQTVALDVSQGSSTSAGSSLFTVRADGSIQGNAWSVDNSGDITANNYYGNGSALSGITASSLLLPFDGNAEGATIFQMSNLDNGTGIEGDAGPNGGDGVIGATGGTNEIGVWGYDGYGGGGVGVGGYTLSGTGASGTAANGIGVQGYLQSNGIGSAMVATNAGTGSAISASSSNGDAIDAVANGGLALNATGNVAVTGTISSGGTGIVLDGTANDRTITSDESIDIVTTNGDVELNPSSNVIHAGGPTNTANIYANSFYGDGSNLTNVNATLSLPYYQSQSYDGALFIINNSGPSTAILGSAGSGAGVRGDATSGDGVLGSTSSDGVGVSGSDESFDNHGTGVMGFSVNGTGVSGSAQNGGTGVEGMIGDGQTGTAIVAQNNGTGDAIDANVSGSGYALNATGNVQIAGTGSITASAGYPVLSVTNTDNSNGDQTDGIDATVSGGGNVFSGSTSGAGAAFFGYSSGSGQIISANQNGTGDVIDANTSGSGIGLSVSTTTGAAISAYTSNSGDAIDATATGTGYGLNVSSVNESAISVNVSGTANGIDVAIPDGGGYAINANSSNNSNATMHVVNTASSDAIDVVSNGGIGLSIESGSGAAISASSSSSNQVINVVNNGNGDAIDVNTDGNGFGVNVTSGAIGTAISATANDDAVGIKATANGDGDALDVSNTTYGGAGQAVSITNNSNGADQALNVTNSGSGSGIYVSAASGYDAIVAVGGGNGGNALNAHGSISQVGETVDVSAGNITLDGNTNIYELTAGGSTTVTLPQTNTQSQVIYVYNSTTHSQTVNGVSMATGHGASYVYFPSSGWILTASF